MSANDKTVQPVTDPEAWAAAQVEEVATGLEQKAKREVNKARGMGRVYQRGRIWWVEYWRRGRQYRESTGSPDEAKAWKLLKRRLGEMQARTFVGPQEERVTFADLERLYLQDYEVRGLRSKTTAELRAHHLKGFFDEERAVDITPARIRDYQAARLKEDKAQAGTVNRETAALHRMFRLALKAGLLSTVPAFPEHLEENPPRQGFFEHAEYQAVRAHLPAAYQDVLDFCYWTGWRRREVTDLRWDEVDLAGGVVRLSPLRSKTKAGRLLPLSWALQEVLERRLAAQREDCPLVFYYRDGLPVGDWRKTWSKACKAAKLPGKLIHDCRRTAARNLVRSGVPERVAMTLLGHRTRNIFDRYNIVSEGDLRQAADRLARYLANQPTNVSEATQATETRPGPAQNPHTGEGKDDREARKC